MTEPVHPFTRLGAWLPIVAIVAMSLVGGLIFVILDRGDGEVVLTAPTTTAAPATTLPTSAPTLVPESLGTIPADGAVPEAVWPVSASSQRYDDPVAAATGFATELVGFTDPVVGPFVADPVVVGTGTVEVRATADGPATLVTLRDAETWWVTGSSSADIVVDQPTTLAAVTSPVTLSGRASAFEGTVDVTVLADGSATPLGQGFVTGGGNGQLGEFSSTLDFVTPTAPAGTIVFSTRSAEDNRVWQATVVRVQYAGA